MINYNFIMLLISLFLCFFNIVCLVVTVNSTKCGLPMSKKAMNEIIIERKVVKNAKIKKYIFLKNIFYIFNIICYFILSILFYKSKGYIAEIIFYSLLIIEVLIQNKLNKKLDSIR